MVKSNSIPLTKCHLKIINNSSLQNMRTLWAKYGGQNKILMNGPFFSFSTYKPMVHMKINGKVIYKPAYKEYGIAWNEGEAPVWTLLPTDKYDNYFTNTVVIPNGQKRENLSSHVDADGTKSRPRYTSRPAFGFKGNNFMTYMKSNGLSLWGLQDLLYRSGWKYALVGDGGGSTAYRDSKTEYYTSRKIPYWILITIGNDNKEFTPSDKCPYKEPTILIKQGSKGEGAKWVQWHLWKLGYLPNEKEVDGVFGSKSAFALLTFQKKVFTREKDWDGKCGPATRLKLKAVLN